jgi:hypothetical protein
MSTPSSATPVRECTNCGYPIPPGRRSLCPNCHHPLLFDERDDTPGAVAATGLHKPTEAPPAAEDTVPVATVPQGLTPAPPVPGQTCPACGHQNPSSQLRCERCASNLVSQAPAPLPPSPAPPPPTRRAGLVVGLVAAALVVALGLGFGAYWLSRPPATTTTGGLPRFDLPVPTPTITARPSTAPELKKIKRKSIKAKASSTLPSGDFTYGVDNTLDGDPETAWNSDGDVVGPFARVTLTYRFSDPVELRAIEVYNGYQRSTKAYYNNSRVRSLLVSTDATKQTFELLDKQGKQTVSFDFGQTKRVVLTVDAVYRDVPKKTRYNDCAISEVTFYRAS